MILMNKSNSIEFEGITYIPKPKSMYVLMGAWNRILAPASMPATIGFCEYEARAILDVLPVGISTSKERLEERAQDLKKHFPASFEGFQILDVGVFE